MPQTGATNFIKQMLLDVQTTGWHQHTAIVRDCHTSLSPVDKSSQQTLITETLKLSDIARRSNTRILNIPCKRILLSSP